MSSDDNATELQKRLADFNGEVVQRRWSNPRPRSRANSTHSPRPLSDTELARLSTTISSDVGGSSRTTSPYCNDDPIVRIERVEGKVGDCATNHKLLQEVVTDLQNRLVSVEQQQKIPARENVQQQYRIAEMGNECSHWIPHISFPAGLYRLNPFRGDDDGDDKRRRHHKVGEDEPGRDAFDTTGSSSSSFDIGDGVPKNV